MSDWYELIHLIRNFPKTTSSNTFTVGKWKAYVDYTTGRVELCAPDEQSQFLAQLPQFVAVGKWVTCSLSDLDEILNNRFKNMYGHAAESAFKSFVYRASVVGGELTADNVHQMVVMAIAKTHSCALNKCITVKVTPCYNKYLVQACNFLIKANILQRSYVAKLPWYCRYLPFTKNNAESTWTFVGNAKSIQVEASFVVDSIVQKIKTSMCVA